MKFKNLILIVLSFFLIIFLVHSIYSLEDKSFVRATLLSQDPDPVYAGDVVELKFKIENFGASTLEDIQVQILPKYPFSLYSGEDLINIGKLGYQIGGEAAIITYKIQVDKNAIEGDNEIELIITKGNSVLKEYVDNEFNIKIKEYDIPEIKVYLQDKTILAKNSKGTITLELANVDKGNANYLQLTLLPSQDYTLLSQSNYVYLGNLKSDDTESQEFEIYIGDLNQNSVSIPILLQYQDDNEKNYEDKTNLSFDIYSKKELKKFGLVKNNYFIWIIFFFLIVFLTYKLYKHNKKKHKHQ